MMKQLTIHRSVQAWQWNGETEPAVLPQGFHPCLPEVEYSQGGEDRGLYLYFTYADLHSSCWISASPLTEKPEVPFMGQVVEFKPNRHTTHPYYRQILPFAFWSIKSESSRLRDWKAVYLDRTRPGQVEAFLDYCTIEKRGVFRDQGFALPPRLEYREMSGSYGRGFRPHYLAPGSWLVIDGELVKVYTELEFTRLRASLTVAGSEEPES